MIDFLLGVPGKLKTISDYLTTYWTSARAGKVDNLDAAISTRASAASLSAAAAYLDATVSSRQSSIKAIQRGTIVISGGSASATATITSVVTSKTELRYLGSLARWDGTNATSTPMIVLTNSTTITASRPYTDANSATVSWELTEYN